MVIEVQLYGELRRFAPSSSSGMLTADVPDGITVKELLEELEINLAEIQLVKINNDKGQLQHILVDGDCVALFDSDK